MDWIPQYAAALLQISLSTAAVIGVLLLLVPLWQRRYSARWRKVIWLMLAVRLLVPFSLELPQTAVQLEMDLQAAPAWQGGQVIADSNATEPAIIPAADLKTIQAVDNRAAESQVTASPAATVTPMQRPISRGVLFFIIGLVGAVGFLLWHGVQYGAFRRKALAVAQPLEDDEALLRQAAADLKLKAVPHVAVSAAVQGPMLMGFAKPVIVLPQRFYSEQELTLILRHELVHYKLHDLWYKLILLIANAVHWFNPLVWLMVRQANRDVEQVCDAFVVRNQDLDYRKAYSMTILQTMANQRGIALSTYLSKQAQNSKKRFAAILYPQKYGKGVLALAAVALLAVTASGCLQVGAQVESTPLDTPEGIITLYETVAPWLPEGAVEDAAQYTARELEYLEQIKFVWGQDELAVLTSSQYPPSAQYPQGVTIQADAKTGDIQYFSYWYDKEKIMLPEIEPSFYKDQEASVAYLQQFAKAFIQDGETLEFQLQYEQPRWQQYTALDEKNHFQYTIGLSTEHGYVSYFRKEYYHTEQRQQAYDWLQQQYRTRLGEHFQLSSAVWVSNGEVQLRKGDAYIWNITPTVYWRPKMTDQFQQQLEQLKQIDEAQYQLLADNMERLYEYVATMRVQGEIGWNGKLKSSSLQVFSGSLTNEEPWTEQDWQRLDSALQLGWTAASYANAWNHHYPEAMALYGETDGVVFSDTTYTDGQWELVRSCQLAMQNYAGEEQYQVDVEFGVNQSDTQAQYLRMNLEQIDGQWRVTSAELQRR